jgi:hypothetical protein
MSTGEGTDQAIRLAFSLGLDDGDAGGQADPMRAALAATANREKAGVAQRGPC